MLIKYSWAAKTDDPDEINGVEFQTDADVPRIGEHVSLNVTTPDDDVISKYGKISRVLWNVGDNVSVSVRIGE